MERRTQELLAQAEGRAPSRGGTADSENDDIFGFGAKAISEDALREMRRQVREAVQAQFGACELQAQRNLQLAGTSCSYKLQLHAAFARCGCKVRLQVASVAAGAVQLAVCRHKLQLQPAVARYICKLQV